MNAIELFKGIVCVVFSFNAIDKADLLVRGTLIAQDSSASFQQHGVSHQRFDGDGIHLSQAVLSTEYQLKNDWSIAGVLNAYSDGEQRAGISQLFIKYRPVGASSIKPEVKIGMFYPALSAENTDIGWLSSHFLTNSAVNSWIGEELRIGGVEVSIAYFHS